jgi:hypothetical protein
MPSPLQRFVYNQYAKTMADRLKTPGLSPVEQERIQRAIDQGFTNIAYHSTPDLFDDIDLNYTDVGFHAGTPVQARNRALDKAISAGLQRNRSEGIYIPETNVLPLAYRPGPSVMAQDVGEWKDAYTALLGLRNVPELEGMQDWMDEGLEHLERVSYPYGGTGTNDDWMTSPENLTALSELREKLLNRGIRQIEYENTYESEPGLMLPEYEKQLERMSGEARRLYQAGLERSPRSMAPDLNAPPEAIEAFLQQRSPDPLSYLSPEERALYDKYRNDMQRIEFSPSAFDPTTSRIFLDPADLRSIYAPFDPSKAREAGLWKAEGGPVEMNEGGPVFNPDRINSLAEELISPYYEFEPVDPEADDVQYFQAGGLYRKARQWLGDTVEEEVGRFKQRTPLGADPEQAIQELQEAMAKQDIQSLPEENRAFFQQRLEDLQRKTALNSWLGRTATKYIKRDYATEFDPLMDLELRHVEGDWPPGDSEMAGLQAYRASDYLSSDSELPAPYREEILQKNPWIANLDPDEDIYDTVNASSMGLSHLVDELKNAIDPNSDLPRELTIRPESLQRMSFPQASELVGKINRWRADQKVAVDSVVANNAATQLVKEYPEGYRWVELALPSTLPEGWKRLPSGDYRMPDGTVTSRGWGERQLQDALKYEGDTMQHCVGGYCEPVMSGATKVFSLRDAQGRPHVTIEAQPQFHPYNTEFDEYWAALDAATRARGEAPDRNRWYDRYLDDPDRFAAKAAELLGNKQDIVQIKGKQNAAPVSQYVPYVQDFIRSQDWGDIRELQHAGMIDATRQPGRANQPPQRYMTQQEYDDYLLSLLRDEQGNGMKEGGEVKDDNGTLDALAEKYPKYGSVGDAAFAGNYSPYRPGKGLEGLTMPALLKEAPSLLLMPAALAKYFEKEDLANALMPKDFWGMIPDFNYADWAMELGEQADKQRDEWLEFYGQPALDDMDALEAANYGAVEMMSQPGLIPVKVMQKLPKAAKYLSDIAEFITPISAQGLGARAFGGAMGAGMYGLGAMGGEEEPEQQPTAVTPEEEARIAKMVSRQMLGYADGGVVQSGAPSFDPERINALALELMEPQGLQDGGRPVRGGSKSKIITSLLRGAGDVPRGKLDDAELSRIEQAVEGDVLSTGPAREDLDPGRRRGYGRSTIRGAERKLFPGIYDDPREIVERASARVAPENPAMEQLFGVTREDLSRIAMDREPTSYLPPGAPARPRGTEYADLLTKPGNTQRLQDILSEAMESPLRPGMTGWYIMDPAYRRLVDLVGPEEAARRYTDFNVFSGIHSANAPVESEITRGSALNWLNRQGRVEDYIKYGGKMGIPGRPEDMATIPGHYAHVTAHLKPSMKYLETGQLSREAKTPAYMAASLPPELGTNINFPVGDAHYSRAIGLGDVRPMTQDPSALGASWSMPEAMQLHEWFARDVARPVGLPGVPAQALLWGAASPITGVKSLIGAPKLEILADQIMKTAKRLRITPEEARDLVLMGEAYAGKAEGGLINSADMIGA